MSWGDVCIYPDTIFLKTLQQLRVHRWQALGAQSGQVSQRRAVLIEFAGNMTLYAEPQCVAVLLQCAEVESPMPLVRRVRPG